jgi:acyl-CoA thioester hydrolase
MAELNIRIDWSELDLYGHVNNVMIFKYVQAARISYCETIGLDTLNDKTRPGFILAATNVQYRKKILYPGTIRIESHVEGIGTTSFRLTHHIYGEQNELLAEGTDVIVVYDYNKNEKMPVPDDVKQSIQEFEGNTFSQSSKESASGQYPDIE